MSHGSRPRTLRRVVAAPSDGLCLDFANTRYWRGSEHPTETLSGLGDLLAWCESGRILDRHAVAELQAWEKRNRRKAGHLFTAAIEIREAIYRLFGAVAAGEPPSGADMSRLNHLLAVAPCRAEIAVAGEILGWRVPPAEPNAANLLAPVLWSAGDLLVGARLPSMRRCANEACRWLFLDDSKSGTRRWCSMSACGNRAKAHRHYLRKTGRTG
jgi:predicted RNA-binding Zn ribbon-like protein